MELNSKGLYLSLKTKIVVLSSIKREFRQFHVVVVQWWQRSVHKSVIHMESFLLRILSCGAFSHDATATIRWTTQQEGREKGRRISLFTPPSLPTPTQHTGYSLVCSRLQEIGEKGRKRKAPNTAGRDGRSLSFAAPSLFLLLAFLFRLSALTESLA